MDPAFKGAGQRPGTEIWRIVDFQPVPLAKSEYGKFYSGDSYIVLQTRSRRGGTNSYDIHFWIGTETSKDEAGTAAIKTIELDANLGGRAVQHRELQGHESDNFLSYFKPCIIPLEGGVASGFKNPEEEKFETRLYACTGKRVAKLKQVPFSISSLNHDDVFILDTQNTIYQFNGAKSNIQERAKALEVIHFFKECYHEGKCDFIIVEDGKLQPQSELGDFWGMFGGFAPIGNKEEDEEDIIPKTVPATLYSITNGQLKTVEGILSKPMLESRKCYILDCGVEVFVWVGRLTQVEDRKTSIQAAEKYISSQNKPKSTRLTQIMQGNETRMFKANFNSWPSGSGTSSAEDGVGKVTALLQQKGLGVQGKSTTKAALVTEEVPPLLERGGKVEVWRINDSAKTLVPKEDIGKFYSGDCYIVLYTCHSDTRKEDYFLCNWIGNDSLEDDQKVAARLAHAMSTTLKGRPTQGRIFQGKESPQFIAIFQLMVILKGGLSSSYRNFIADKGLADETYAANNVALIEISGTSIHNTKGIQVDAVATSLNSHECFLLQSGSSIFIWHGNQSTFKQQQFSTKVAEFLRPGVALKHINEGTESLSFFSALGGKQIYTSKQAEEIVREPHLFTGLFNKEKFEVEEVHNFSQDDLLTEDIMILDTHAEVFVWVGRSVSSIEKQRAFEVGQNYINMTVSLEGLAPNIPLYKITEGNEPCFFTAYFSWDSTKASLQGNSFQKKVLLLFSENEALVNQVKSNEANLGGTTQRASALAALTAALNPSSDRTEPKGSPRPAFPSPSSQRAAAVAALSSVLKAEKKHDGSPTQSLSSLSSRQDTSPFENSEGISDDKEQEGRVSVTESSGETIEDKTPGVNEIESTECTFTYDQLKTTSDTPATGIDFQKREAYLSDEEFEKILGMTKNEFYKMPKWKQGMTKKKNDLF